MAGEPKFFSKNFADAETMISFVPGFPLGGDGVGAATLYRLFDRDTEGLKWRAGLPSSFAYQILFEFNSGGQGIARTFDTVILVGHNASSFTLRRWDGGAVYTSIFVGAETPGTNKVTVMSVGANTSQKIRLDLSATGLPGSPNFEATEIFVLSTKFAFPTDQGPSRIDFGPVPTSVISGMADKGQIVNMLRWAGNRVERFRARVGFNLLAKADYDSLRQLVRDGLFTCYLEPVERPSEIFTVTATPGGAPSAYSSLYKANGYDLSLELEEH